jgi:drug/metabolite transporter (DMT)-like permease
MPGYGTGKHTGRVSMQAAGIALGLSAAMFQSASYVFSRLYVVRRQGAVTRLMLTSHLLMGLASLVLLPVLYRADAPSWTTYIVPLVGAAGFYIMGQAGLFMLLRRAEMSRVAPLLGFKIVILALVTTLFLGRQLGGTQWAAVAVSVTAALVLRSAGGPLPWRSVGWVLFICLGYSLSDLHIEWLVRSLAPLDKLHASAYGACLTLVLCGGVALVCLPFFRSGGVWVDWHFSVPYSFCWLAATVCLFACFAYVGTVYGNILQSTRGIMSVVMAALLARLGWFAALEGRMPRGVFARRLGAAVLMCAAIWLFVAQR